MLNFEFSAGRAVGKMKWKERREMHPDLEKLIVLQGLDVEAKRLRDEMAALPKQVAELEKRAKATVGQRAFCCSIA